MTPQDLQTLIRDARQKAGITQAELAERIGVGKPTVNQFETGKQNITVDVLCRMFTALDLRLVAVDEHRQQVVDQIVSLAKEL